MNKRRLAIYVFWEKEGIVRQYVYKYLLGLLEVAERVIVVVNGTIRDSDRSNLESKNICVTTRENKGVDFWAYKHGLELVGADLASYDELVLCNCSCYGPVGSFKEMFEEMSLKNVDFWGITEWPLNRGGYSGTWILSYFMVFRPHVFLSDVWQKYWESLCPVNSRDEAIHLHEIPFTSYFSERGFKYDVYCPNTVNYVDSTIESPDDLVINNNCPIIKRKAFATDYMRFLLGTRGNKSAKLYEYLKKTRKYDVNVIIEDLLSTREYYDVFNALQLNYVLPSDRSNENLGTHKAIVCCHLYYEDLVETNLEYLKNIPHWIDLFISTPKKELAAHINSKLAEYGLQRATVEVVNSRGRAESAFLVATKNFILDYDYACIVHDKKSSFLKPGSQGLEFGLHCIESLLYSKCYIENIVNLFENEPLLGILEPVNLMYGSFQGLYGTEWGANYESTLLFLNKLGLNVPISPDSPPVAPMGAMFWFRPKAFKKLFEVDWEYEDFPEEPLPLDGSLIHVIERAYPLIAQESGYLTGWVSPEKVASNHILNLAYLYRARNIELERLRHSFNASGVGRDLTKYERLLKKMGTLVLPRRVYSTLKAMYFRLVK